MYLARGLGRACRWLAVVRSEHYWRAVGAYEIVPTLASAAATMGQVSRLANAWEPCWDQMASAALRAHMVVST